MQNKTMKKDLLVLWPWISILLGILLTSIFIPLLMRGHANTIISVTILFVLMILVLSFFVTFIMSHIYIIHELYTADLKMSDKLKKSWLSWIIIVSMLFGFVNLVLLPIFHFKYLHK